MSKEEFDYIQVVTKYKGGNPYKIFYGIKGEKRVIINFRELLRQGIYKV